MEPRLSTLVRDLGAEEAARMRSVDVLLGRDGEEGRRWED